MVHISHAHKKFKEHLNKSGKSPHTIRSYEKHIDDLVNFLLEMKKEHAHLVTKDDLKKFIAKAGKKKSAKSINAKTVALKSFFRFLEMNEYITENPAHALEYLKEKETKPRILSVVEYRALRDTAKNDIRYYAIIELMLQTGITIGEVTRIKLSDLHLKNDAKLDIRDRKEKLNRSIPLNSSAKKAIEEYLEVRPKAKSETLFITRTGKAIDPRNIRMTIDSCYKKAGIKDARVHDLRHTFCAHHLKKGTSIAAVAYMAGHKNLNTTRKYLEFTKSPEMEEIEKNSL
ncbi:tyrosine-type recombinase/integrase [bacterium]|nr:tyrosine-type recombinase/integrase [bacterium]